MPFLVDCSVNSSILSLCSMSACVTDSVSITAGGVRMSFACCIMVVLFFVRESKGEKLQKVFPMKKERISF